MQRRIAFHIFEKVFVIRTSRAGNVYGGAGLFLDGFRHRWPLGQFEHHRVPVGGVAAVDESDRLFRRVFDRNPADLAVLDQFFNEFRPFKPEVSLSRIDVG